MIDTTRFTELVDRIEADLTNLIVDSGDKLVRQRALRVYNDNTELLECVAKALERKNDL
jgi:hypothetical protein